MLVNILGLTVHLVYLGNSIVFHILVILFSLILISLINPLVRRIVFLG